MMKTIFFLFVTCAIFSSCDIRHNDAQHASIANGGNKSNVFTDTTSVQIIDSVYNFGKVTDGENVVYSYRFKNNGSKPLVISQASASCGCTVPEKPEQPIKPGETGFLKIVFNSTGRVGPVHKEVTVISNAYPAFPILQLIGEVVSSNK